MGTQDTTSPFNDDNTKPVPDAPGLWFYHATGYPVIVIEKEDGLYFQAKLGKEEMKLEDFAKLKAAHPQLSKFSFTKLSPKMDVKTISTKN